MAAIAPVSSSAIQAAPQANAAQPSLMSQVTQQITVAAGLESDLADTLDKAVNGDADAATLVQLQVQTQGLSLSTATLSHLIASLTETAKNAAHGL